MELLLNKDTQRWIAHKDYYKSLKNKILMILVYLFAFLIFFFNLLFSRAFQLSINFLFLKSDKKYYPFLILHSSSICYFLYQMAPFLQGIMLRMNLLFLKSEAMLAYYSFSIHSSYPTTIQVPFLFFLYWMAICIVHFFFCIPL